MKPLPSSDFVEIDSRVPGITVFAPAAVPEPEMQSDIEFKCPQCGAVTAYNVVDGQLTCSHCSYAVVPNARVIGRQAEKSEFTLDNLERSVYGWGGERKELDCQNCGAQTTKPGESISATCPFCGSNKVLQSAVRPDQLRPRFLIPFKLDPEKCQSIVRTWLGSSWMTPETVKQFASLGAFTPIYLPFWTFHATTNASWKAEVGHTVTERYYDAGSKEWRTRTRIDWRWESGEEQLRIDDLLVPGTEQVSQLHLGKINNFDLSALLDYDPHYLAGFQAQAYDRKLEQAWELGRQEMREQTRKVCLEQASTSQIRNFRMNLDFSNESWRYLLLPVYIAAYQYDARIFQVLVNGQTGTVSGQRPVDWNKVWLVIALILSPGVLGGLIGLITLPLAGVGLLVGGIGFVLLVIGLIISFMIISKANQQGDA